MREDLKTCGLVGGSTTGDVWSGEAASCCECL